MADYVGNDESSVATLLSSGATAVAFSPDYTHLYVATNDGFIRVFDVATHQLVSSWDIGVSLGSFSVSEDGTFLIVLEKSGASTLYRVDTSTGASQTFTTNGSPYLDVEIVDANTAILTGGQSSTVTRVDLSNNSFSPVPNSPNHSVMVEDGRYTLMAVPGTSDGPLFLYDDQTDSIVSTGNTYETPNTGFNWGSQAISEEAGLVLQFIYYGSINVYDLNLDFVKTINLGQRIDGLVFDATGTYFYAYLIDAGKVVKYTVATAEVVEEYTVDTAEWHNNIGFGTQLLIDPTGRYLTVMSNDGSGMLQLVDLSARFETFPGTEGADSFTGGMGDDTYVINHPGDVIIEQAEEGIDVAQASVSFALSDFVESLVLTGSGSIDGTGNAGANTISGNSGANVLSGDAGDDVLNGGGGNDTLNGHQGNDTLDGGSGLDTLAGGTGNDTYIVDANDVLVEHAGEGTDSVRSAINFSLGANFENLTLTGAAAVNGAGNASDNILIGNSGTNTLTGNAGNDWLDGNAGNDILIGGAGDDTYVFDGADTLTEQADGGVDTVRSSVTYTLTAQFENLTLTGSSSINGTGNGSANVIVGNSGINALTGGGGNDFLDGGQGDDWLYGGLGNDTYVVDSALDTIIEDPGQGVDTVVSSVGYTLGSNLENLTLTGDYYNSIGWGNELANIITGNVYNNNLYGAAGADTMFGEGGSDVLSGDEGDDYLNGGAGDDILYGGAGNDTYEVDGFDSVYEGSDGGTDTVRAGFSYTLNSSIENLILTGGSSANGVGNSANNVMIGNSASNALSGGVGDDTLDGGQGDDILTGGVGNDTLTGGIGSDLMACGDDNDKYQVDNIGDVVTETAGGGTDTIYTTLTYALAAGSAVEFLRTADAAGSTIINLTGNEFGQEIVGNAAENNLFGLGGNDLLDGRTGADRMTGGTGNDRYRVDNTADRVTELVGEGTDTIYASVSYGLRAGLAVETLRTSSDAGTAAINLTGNEFAQTIVGNAGANTINGGGGDDKLDGGAGIDKLYGGLGNDTYYVDTSSDRTVEVVGQGTDTVIASASAQLRAGTSIEILRTSNGNGTTAINLTGNEFAQSITGNAGANTINGGGGDDALYGGLGNDRLYGGTGNDTLDGGASNDRMVGSTGDDDYLVDNAGDKVTEVVGEGTDTVSATISYTLNIGSEVEVLRTSDEAAITSINLTGNEFAQTITGNAGANVLNGGAGDDTLTGGGGADDFVFSNLGGADHISDFLSGTDTIDFSALDANVGMEGDQAFTFIGSNAFGSVACQLRTYVSDGVRYVAGDVDGDGVADFTIDLGGANVFAADFLL